jgi:Protein kinase domain
MGLAPGTRVGSYEIVSALGAGGMGEVYRARDTELRRDVAVKVLPASLGSDPDRLARFRREAQVLASLNHPNIAAIYGLEEGALVLELVDGPTLADLTASGPLPIREALSIAGQICEALDAAHDQGIVHRDLKPANIKVRPTIGEGPGLRIGEGGRHVPRRRCARRLADDYESGGAEWSRGAARNGSLYEPGAGSWQAGGQALGHLGIRVRAVRDADGQARIRWRRCDRYARSRVAARSGFAGAASGHAGSDAAAFDPLLGEGSQPAAATDRCRLVSNRRSTHWYIAGGRRRHILASVRAPGHSTLQE